MAILAATSSRMEDRASEVELMLDRESFAGRAIGEKPLSIPSIPIEDSLFYLSPGDRLLLRWWGVGEGQEQLVVDSRYQLLLPDIGAFDVRGKTLQAVRDTIGGFVQRRTKARLVDVQVTHVSDALVRINGWIAKSRMISAPAGTRLSQILESAGLDVSGLLHQPEFPEGDARDLNRQPPSLRRIRLVRTGMDTIWIDLSKGRNQGLAAHDPPLFYGDLVTLYPRGKTVALSGSVPRPGHFEVLGGETYSELLRAAGVDSIPAELEIISANGGRNTVGQATVLGPDASILFLAERMNAPSPPVVWVVGRVARPGPVPIREGLTVAEAIGAAGGIRGGVDSGIAVSVKRGWQSIGPARGPGAPEAIQYPEVRQAVASYQGRMRGTYSSGAVPLESGDSILVHAAERVVWVGGEVLHPGYVRWSQGRDIEDYVADAGGYAGRPWKKKTVLFDPYSGQVVKDGNVRPGAAILVPEKQYIYPLTWLSTVATMVSLFVAVGTFYLTATQ